MSASKPFHAMTAGSCGSCGSMYRVGAMVRTWDDSICHKDCVEDEGAAVTTVMVMRGPQGAPVAIPTDIVSAAERPYRAYLLKQGGHSWEMIAVAEDYPDWKAARADVKRYISEGASLISDFSRKELLELMAARLDALNQAVWPAAMKGNLPAVNAALSITVTAIKLLRLDQDVRDEDDDMRGRTVVVGEDEDSYASDLEVASGVKGRHD